MLVFGGFAPCQAARSPQGDEEEKQDQGTPQDRRRSRTRGLHRTGGEAGPGDSTGQEEKQNQQRTPQDMSRTRRELHRT